MLRTQFFVSPFFVSKSECFDMIRRFSEDMYLNRLYVENIRPLNISYKEFMASLSPSQKKFVSQAKFASENMRYIFDALVQAAGYDHPEHIKPGTIPDEHYRIISIFYDEYQLITDLLEK